MIMGISVILISMGLMYNTYLALKNSKSETDENKRQQIKLFTIVRVISNLLLIVGGVALIMSDIVE